MFGWRTSLLDVLFAMGMLSQKAVLALYFAACLPLQVDFAGKLVRVHCYQST